MRVNECLRCDKTGLPEGMMLCYDCILIMQEERNKRSDLRLKAAGLISNPRPNPEHKQGIFYCKNCSRIPVDRQDNICRTCQDSIVKNAGKLPIEPKIFPPSVQELNFIGTFFTNNKSIVTIFQQSEMIIAATQNKVTIWLGFIRHHAPMTDDPHVIGFNVWDAGGMCLERAYGNVWDLKERIKEKTA